MTNSAHSCQFEMLCATLSKFLLELQLIKRDQSGCLGAYFLLYLKKGILAVAFQDFQIVGEKRLIS